MVTKRRITEKDHTKVAEFITNELKSREANPYRKKHEALWKEVDRQVYMESMGAQNRDPDEDSEWRSALELGELSRASEVLSADINRMTFPQNRSWFDPHTKLDVDLDDNGEPLPPNTALQKRADGQLRAMMSQQHIDFGLKSRQGLSIKEALHHGGYVAEVRQESLLKVSDGSGVQSISAPVWYPHSMWNCYPDSSPSVIGTDMIYTGSMIIKSSMPYHTLKSQREDGWFALDKIIPKKNKEAALVTYFGDITIKRSNGDIFLPNSKAIVADNRLVYYRSNPLPMPEIIYNGYERLDVRDPYYISPLVKMAPTQKIASVITNNFIDILERYSDPAVGYDGSDDQLVKTGGPSFTPGSKVPMRSPQSIVEFKVGDPSAALSGVQFFLSELQKGTSVDAIRSGMSSSVEQTATEVERTRQGGQIRTIDFVDKHEAHGLRPFLYLQHEMNKANTKFSYSFYNPEMDAPDFEAIDVVESEVHFEVVGSKGLAEEERRQAETLAVTQFAASVIPNELNITEIIKDMYQDAGNKNPERYLTLGDEVESLKAEFQEKMEQIQQEAAEALDEAAQKISELETQLAEMALNDEEHDVDMATAKNKISEANLRTTQANTKLIQTQAELKNTPVDNSVDNENMDAFKKDITSLIEKAIPKQEPQPIVINNSTTEPNKSIKIERQEGRISGAKVITDD